MKTEYQIQCEIESIEKELAKENPDFDSSAIWANLKPTKAVAIPSNIELRACK